MKTLLTLFVLLFSSSVLAEDISDFQIEGMSIGDSLLKFYSETEIKNQLSKTHSTRKNTDIKRVYFNISNPDLDFFFRIRMKGFVFFWLAGVCCVRVRAFAISTTTASRTSPCWRRAVTTKGPGSPVRRATAAPSWTSRRTTFPCCRGSPTLPGGARPAFQTGRNIPARPE